MADEATTGAIECSAYNFAAGARAIEENGVMPHCTTKHNKGMAPHNPLNMPHCESGLNCHKGEASIRNCCELGFYSDGTSEGKQHPLRASSQC